MSSAKPSSRPLEFATWGLIIAILVVILVSIGLGFALRAPSSVPVPINAALLEARRHRRRMKHMATRVRSEASALASDLSSYPELQAAKPKALAAGGPQAEVVVLVPDASGFAAALARISALPGARELLDPSKPPPSPGMTPMAVYMVKGVKVTLRMPRHYESLASPSAPAKTSLGKPQTDALVALSLMTGDQYYAEIRQKPRERTSAAYPLQLPSSCKQ